MANVDHRACSWMRRWLELAFVRDPFGHSERRGDARLKGRQSDRFARQRHEGIFDAKDIGILVNGAAVSSKIRRTSDDLTVELIDLTVVCWRWE